MTCDKNEARHMPCGPKSGESFGTQNLTIKTDQNVHAAINRHPIGKAKKSPLRQEGADFLQKGATRRSLHVIRNHPPATVLNLRQA